MGLSSLLIEIGIHVEDLATAWGTRSGTVPLAWPAGVRQSLIHRLPRDPHQRASLFSSVQTILVAEGEVAVVLSEGSYVGVLDAGRYVFEKKKVVGALDIVWVTTGQRAFKWGIGNVASQDGIQVSANGAVYARVVDAARFHTEVVQGASLLSEVDLQRLLMPKIQGAVRAQIARTPALDLSSEREQFADAVSESLAGGLGALGVGLVDIEVIEFDFSAEFKSAIAQATLVRHSAKAALVEAEHRAELDRLAAAARQPLLPPAHADTIVTIEGQIDKLGARLAEGAISEETYKKAVARLEAKLAELKGG
jgi:regulator of protease activity HflC (stomatin/prohibitin superfamily)